MRDGTEATERTGVSSYQRIYTIVRRIPRGRVATYGQIARLAGCAGHARQVGYALHALPDGSRVPWHRVVNVQGRVSARTETGYESLQRTLLEQEGVWFDDRDRLSLERYGWRPRSPAAARLDECHES